MQTEVYTSYPPASISDLCPFPQAIVILIMAWLLTLALTTWWEKSRHRGRLPAVWLTAVLAALLCACTSTANLPGGSYGTWSTGPDDEQASVTIWRSGEAWLRIGKDRLKLRK